MKKKIEFDANVRCGAKPDHHPTGWIPVPDDSYKWIPTHVVDGQIESVKRFHVTLSLVQFQDEAKELDYKDSPISAWFELSYAQFLTVPRLVMESMPFEWQKKMATLLEKMDDTFDWRPKEGRYWVKLKDGSGRFCDAPLVDYRYGNIERLRKAEHTPQAGVKKEGK